MSFYRELPTAAQTAYAELQELVQVAETQRSPASLTGTIGWKTIKGRRYAYWQFKEIDGRKREYYLGPEGAAVEAIEQARNRPVPAQEAVARQARAAGPHGNLPTPARPFRVVKRLADYQFFRAGGLLVGTHAFLALGNQLGVAWGEGTRTLDLDFAHAGPGGDVSVALPANLEMDVFDALKSLQMGFLPTLGGRRGFASHYMSEKEPDLRIDFLTVTRRQRDEVPVPDLGVALVPLKFLNYLLEQPGQAVLLNRADACLVNLPDPARYGLHRLLVAAERGARHAKYNKDIGQALALIEWHLERAPDLLRDAWEDLISRGTGWVRRARQSLSAASRAQQELVARFQRMVGMK